jgi:phosphoglycolate phosphatase-like HAD superfamily hydrolase
MTVTARPNTTIRAVIFDIDGVLLDSREANTAYYRDLLARFGYTDVAEELLARGHYLNLREAIAAMTGAGPERVQEIWQFASDLAGYPEHLLKLPNGCGACLSDLAESYALGVVTSRLRAGIGQFERFSGLGGLFAAAVGYEDYTRPKPHPEPLLVACARLGVTPESAVYVGDAPTDLECALAAGARFVAYGDGISGWQPSVMSFDQLAQALLGLGS